jgi:stage III sporulation protein AG
MELNRIGNKAVDFLKKYRYVVLILVLGIVLMLLPGEDEQEPQLPATEEVQQEPDLSRQLSQLLGQIEGAGKVKVLLTFSEGAQTIYQTDVNTATENGSLSEETKTVLIDNGDRGEEGLIRQIIPAKYLGAVVVCQGADAPAVRLAIVEAVSKVTGLGADRVTVLKMK